jgi:WD40 repeat protein
VTALADGRRALSASEDRTLRLWDLETGAELRRFEGHERVVTCVTVLADGWRALSGSKDKTLRLWDLETGAELARLTFDAMIPGALAWWPERGPVVVGDARGHLHVVELIE